MSAAVMPSSKMYDFGDIFLNDTFGHTTPGYSNSIESINSPGSPGNSSLMSSNCGSTNLIDGMFSLFRWNREERDTLARRASNPLTSNSMASIVSRLLEDHRLELRLDRSQSDPAKVAALNVNTSRYKTELCRPFEENGSCKYGDKCQFAHGVNELRNLVRHPKYKTELCRTFHTTGLCPYGTRCHFIHTREAKSSAPIRPIRPRLCLGRAPGIGSSADITSPTSSSGSPPPSANTLIPSPSSLSPSQSPPPESPDSRLPVFNKFSVPSDLCLRFSELLAS